MVTYETLRFGLQWFQEKLDDTAARCSPVYHQLLRSPKPLSHDAWAAIWAANGRVGLADTSAWEIWKADSDGLTCSRFFGMQSRDGFEQFIRLVSADDEPIAPLLIRR